MPLTILVVEDEESNMMIISTSLKMLGHSVLQAWEPRRGHELARSEQPDLILMDLMFKGAEIDGIEAIRRLKADPLTAGIPVVAQTASVLDFNERTVGSVGAVGFLHKPYRRQQLTAAIEAALNGGPMAAPYLWRSLPVAARAVRASTV